jgi:predicted O-methyltransferase YrrM
MREFGSGPRSELLATLSRPGTSTPRTIGSIYRSSAISHAWGVFLFKLVRELKPALILELGTNLGVSAAYLSTALNVNGGGKLITVEGDETLAEMAREALEKVCPNTATVECGRFTEVLPRIMRKGVAFDMVFVDGHHEYEATIRYFQMFRPGLSHRSCVVFDDVSPWFPGVRRAWNEIRSSEKDFVSFSTGKIALLLHRQISS